MEKKILEVSCPQCGKKFRAKSDKPRTKNQWKVSLMIHLIASRYHNLKTEEVGSIVTDYIASL